MMFSPEVMSEAITPRCRLSGCCPFPAFEFNQVFKFPGSGKKKLQMKHSYKTNPCAIN
jgi:hypothetical protein